MPFRSIQCVLNATDVWQLFIIPTDNHVVKGITLRPASSTMHANEAFATIGILMGASAGQLDQIACASGYVGYNYPLGWTGTMPTELDQGVFAYVIGDIGFNFHLSASYWPIVKQEGALFVVDP